MPSIRLFTTYYFNRENTFKTNVSNFDDLLISESIQKISSAPELDIGIDLNLNFIYLLSRKFGLGISISNIYYFRLYNGTTHNKSIRLNEKREVEQELYIQHDEKRVSFFDNTNFSLILSYKFNK